MKIISKLPLELRKYLPLLLLITFFVIQYIFLHNHTQAIHFRDELEHISGGWEMLNQNKRLYVDISVNHQPLPFLTGNMLLRVFDPPNFFMLIERSRQLMYVISFVGAIFVTIRFGWVGLIVSALIEASKYHIFGYHLLGESLVVYPIVYSGGLIFYLLSKMGKLRMIDDVLFGVSLFVCVFSLLPCIPFAAISMLLYGYNRPKKTLYRVVPTILILFVILSFWVSWPAWYEETIVNVWRYFLPMETQITSIRENLMLFIFPWLSVLNLKVFIAKYYFLVLSFGMLGVLKLYAEIYK